MNRCGLLTANCIVKCIPALRCPQPSGVQNPLAFRYPSSLIETPAFKLWMMMIPQKRGSTILYTIPNARQPNIVYQLYSPLSTCISICWCSTGLGFHCPNSLHVALDHDRCVPSPAFSCPWTLHLHPPHPVRQRDHHSIIYMEMCPTTLPPKDYLIYRLYTIFFCCGEFVKNKTCFSHQW